MYSQNTRSEDYLEVTFTGEVNFISNCWSITGKGGCFYVDAPALNFVMASRNIIANLSAGSAGGLIYSKNSQSIRLVN